MTKDRPERAEHASTTAPAAAIATGDKAAPSRGGRLPFETRRRRRLAVAAVAFAFSLVVLLGSLTQFFGDAALAQDVRPPSSAVNVGGDGAPSGPPEAVEGRVPGNSLGGASDSQLWRSVREGDSFSVSIPDKKSAFLVQSEGEEWRAFRNGPLSASYLYAMGGIIGVLALFYFLRGRIRIEHGPSGETIQRFTSLERFGHWLLATSFVILAISGLNILYGRYLFLDSGLMSKEVFAQLTYAGKSAHNHVAFAFMAGLALTFILWVSHNIPSKIDLQWLAKGGGLFSSNVHPDSRKFNAGQKLIFWSTILLGGSASLSGIALLFPFETAMMGKTFGVLNAFGFNLATDLTPMQEMQYQTTWHGIVSVAMIVIIVAHIYIGSLGMEGAFDAMGSGEVDLNWAKEHHNLWVEEEQAKTRGGVGGSGAAGTAATPAE